MQKKLLPLGILLMSFSLLISCGSSDTESFETNASDIESTTFFSSEQPDKGYRTSSDKPHAEDYDGQKAEGYIDPVEVNVSDVHREAEAFISSLSPAQSIIPRPEASGVLTESNDYAIIDYSNTGEGYVMVQYTASTPNRLKAQVTGPTTTYTYNLTAGEWTVFPLSDGNGSYQINVFENIVDNRYALVLSVTQTVTLSNEFAPFLHSNQYVNFDNADLTIATAASLTQGTDDMLTKVEIIYNYVIDNITYDSEKAATVQSGYLPDLDAVLSDKAGICFDYASLMTGMLRSLGIPCKLVVGYAGDVYHAWISIWSEETGWVDGAVFFDGTTWQRMDPTFASTGAKDPSIMEYIGNGANYTAKYIY